MRSWTLQAALLENSHMEAAEGLNIVHAITFIAGSRSGASGPQTLAANSDVELGQPVHEQ